MRGIHVLSIAIGLAVAPPALAAMRYVQPGQSIQAAIDAAVAGDTIWVAQGTYRERILISRAVTIQGGWDLTFLSQDPALRPTIIKGPDCRDVVHFDLEEATVILEGFSIDRDETQACAISADSPIRIQATDARIYLMQIVIRRTGDLKVTPTGGAVVANLTRSRLEIIDCLFSGIRVLGIGGAIDATLLEGSALAVRGSTIQGNWAFSGSGGGLFVRAQDGSTVDIVGTLLDGNVSGNNGGALFIEASDGRLAIRGSTFRGNSTWNTGGAIFGDLERETFVLEGNTFSKNVAQEVGALDLSLTHEGSGANSIEGCTFERNDAFPPCAWIHLVHATLRIADSIFRDHGQTEPGYRGGAIRAGLSEMAALVLERNRFERNHAMRGGALFASLGPDSSLRSNRDVYLNNLAEQRGGAVEVELHTSGTEATFTNCVLAHNMSMDSRDTFDLSGDGEAIARIIHCTFGPGGIVRSEGEIRLLILNSIFWLEYESGRPRSLYLNSTPALASVRHCAIWVKPMVLDDPYVGKEGNFCDYPGFIDIEGDDYHLQGTSPCIDVGEAHTWTAEDMDGQHRPLGTTFDIGADEVPQLWTVPIEEVIGLLQHDVELGIEQGLIGKPEPAGEIDRILGLLAFNLARLLAAGSAQSCLTALSAMDQNFADLSDTITAQGRRIDPELAKHLLDETREGDAEVGRLDGRLRDEGMPFGRGDPNEDGRINIADAIRTLEILFASRATQCPDAADINDDGGLDIADPIYLLNYSFKSGPAIPPPIVGTCDFDPTPDKGANLGCASYGGCR